MNNLNELKPGQTKTKLVKITDKKIVTTTVEKTKDNKIFMKTKQRMLHRRK